MAKPSFKVEITPAVLRWARESAGYSISDAAARLKKEDRVVTDWESGKRHPTWENVSQLAKVYKRSAATLLLTNQPADKPLPTDFRKLPTSKRKLSPKTLLANRTARWLANQGQELESELGIRPSFQLPRATLRDDPEVIAAACREVIGVNLETQRRFTSDPQAFQAWRTAVEAQGVFVFQFSMPLVEVRGFSLTESETQAIVLNRSDGLTARIFTLFHEFAHLCLRRPGICMPEETAIRASYDPEAFCNRFAAAFLIPSSERPILEKYVASDGAERAAKMLAAQYRVSRYVVLGRMRTLGCVDAMQHDMIYQAWQRIVREPKSRRGGGGESSVKRCFGQRGKRLVNCVMSAVDRNLMTTGDALKYLNIKLTDISMVRARLRKSGA